MIVNPLIRDQVGLSLNGPAEPGFGRTARLGAWPPFGWADPVAARMDLAAVRMV